MGHFIPTNATATAEATARLFFDRIITIHGIPATLISDRDPKFTSKFWKELMGLLGTKLAMSSAYHPQTDGQTERLNQVVEQLLRTACKDDVSHWDTQLPTLEFAYNNATHAATGKTPFFLCYGREPLTPQQPTTPAHVQAAHDFVTTMQQLWEKTQRRLTTMQNSQKQYADRQRRDHSVAVGDQVLLDTRNLNLSHLPSKLRPRFCGPFLVEAQVTPVTFRLRLPDTWKLHNAFHVQLLKPYKDPNQQFQGRRLPPPPLILTAASRSSPGSALCSCHPLSHETLLWHHRLGHPSLPRLRGMASRTLVSGLPRSLPPLPPGPAPTCVPCVEGRKRAAPHSSEFPSTEAPLQTLHMDVWGLARVSGQGHERYFLLVVDDYSRYTTVFPLRSKGEVTETFTLPASPQQNGIAERRIGMVMDVARTSMIHAAAPHFLCPFAAQYAAHQINLQPRVSLLEPTPTLRWRGKVGDASVFRVWGSRSFVRNTSADKLSSRDVPCGPAPSGVCQVEPTEPVEVAVDSGAGRGAEPAGAGTGGAEPGVSVSEGVEPGGAEPERVEPGGAEPGGAEYGSAEPGGAEPARAASGGPPGVLSRREPLSPQQLREWYARHCRGAARAAGAAGAAGAGGAAGAAGGAAGAGAAGGAAGDTGAVGGPAGVGVAGGAGAAGLGGALAAGTGAAGAGGAAGVGAASAGAVATGGASGAGAAGGTGAGGDAGVVAGDPGAEGIGAVSAVSGGAARPRPYYVPLLQQVLGLPPSPGPTPPLLSPPPVQSHSQLQPTSPLPGPSPYSRPTRGLTERREHESRPVSRESRSALPVRTVCPSRRVSRTRPPLVPGTHPMTLRPSTAPRCVPLPSPPASSLPASPDPESDSLCAASPTVTRFLATAVTDPLFESTVASALVAELVDFAAA
ncbi:unnamed protein product [Closterium sp. NIES-54]